MHRLGWPPPWHEAVHPRPTHELRCSVVDFRAPVFRVIAEGDDDVGRDLTLEEAIAVAEFAREHGKRHVAIVDDTTSTLVDESTAHRWVRRGAPSVPEVVLVPCPACQDEGGEPTGDVLVQLPSGAWVRETCDFCGGVKRLDAKEVARRRARTVRE